MSKKSKPRKLFKGNRNRTAIFALVFAVIGTLLLIITRAATIAPTGTYTDWYWPASSSGYQSFEWEVTPQVDPSPQGYFWSHQFQFNNGDGGYFGLQTVGSNPTGKIAIFSIWQALASEGPEVATTFGGEGEGYTARIKYPWVSGQAYGLRIAKQTTTNGNWWGAWVKDKNTNVESYVGQIKIPDAWNNLSNWSVMWTEFYSAWPSSCDQMKYSGAIFSQPTANNGTVTPNSHNNHLANPVNCPGSKITEVSGGVLQEMAIPATTQPPSPSDNTSPIVTISTPTDGQFISGKTQISGVASDNIGVISMELYINGALKQSSNDAIISYSWNPPRGKGKNNDGTQTIELKAKDQAGNVGSTTIKVYTK